MADGDTPAGGLFDSLRRLADSALGLVQRRLELFALELQEEKVRALDLVFRAVAVLVLALLTLIAGTATLVVALWDFGPVKVLLAVTLLYAVAAGVIGLSIRRRLRHGPKPFAGTIEEFRKDRACFGKRN